MELRDFEIKQRNDRAMKAVEKYGTCRSYLFRV